MSKSSQEVPAVVREEVSCIKKCVPTQQPGFCIFIVISLVLAFVSLMIYVSNVTNGTVTIPQPDVATTSPGQLFVWYPVASDPNGNSIEQHNEKFFPKGTRIRRPGDVAPQDAQVAKISKALQDAGVVEGVAQVFGELSTSEQRSDMFRTLALWMHGGLFLEEGLALTAPVSNFLNMQNDTLVLPVSYGNTHSGLMFSAPRQQVVERMIKMQVQSHGEGRWLRRTYVEETVLDGQSAVDQPRRDLELVSGHFEQMRHRLNSGEVIECSRHYRLQQSKLLVACWDLQDEFVSSLDQTRDEGFKMDSGRKKFSRGRSTKIN